MKSKPIQKETREKLFDYIHFGLTASKFSKMTPLAPTKINFEGAHAKKL